MASAPARRRSPGRTRSSATCSTPGGAGRTEPAPPSGLVGSVRPGPGPPDDDPSTRPPAVASGPTDRLLASHRRTADDHRKPTARTGKALPGPEGLLDGRGRETGSQFDVAT